VVVSNAVRRTKYSRIINTISASTALIGILATHISNRAVQKCRHTETV
jgi:hypothetical protein